MLPFHRLAPYNELPISIDFEEIKITPTSRKPEKKHNMKKMWIYQVYNEALEKRRQSKDICLDIANAW